MYRAASPSLLIVGCIRADVHFGFLLSFKHSRFLTFSSQFCFTTRLDKMVGVCRKRITSTKDIVSHTE